MFDKKTLVAAFLSFVTIFGVQILFRDWFSGSIGTVEQVREAGSAYTIPSAHDLALPAVKTVSFAQAVASEKAELIEVVTPRYHATFNTMGGTLEALSYPGYNDKVGKPLQAIHPAIVPDQASFVVALGDETPLYYRYEDQKALENGDQAISFSARTADWLVRKTFVFHNDKYLVDLLLELVAKSSHPEPIRPRVFIGAPHLPALSRDAVSGVVLDVAKNTVNQVTDSQRAGDAWVTPQIIGVENSYFAHALVADKNGFAQRGYFTGAESSWVSAIVEGPVVTGTTVYTLSFFVGPKSLNALNAVDGRLSDLLAFGWLSWIAKLLMMLLMWLYAFCENYGLAIIALTALVKLFLLPLSWKSAAYTEMQQKLQPRMAGLRKKYAHDTAAFNTEVMRLYQEHNISPASFMFGCLLMIPQMLIFFAMYRVLGNVVDMYQAPFFGWITDLSSADPYYILPALAVGAIFFQPMVMPGQSDDSRATIMRYLLPAVLATVFVRMPAGLLLFIVTNFLVTILEQKFRKLFA
ncbi:MAG: YidC/Oxa1 family rane protein insertase [Candidatus Dependentiae bacterium]|nr:YidC/Oxa1 family rane protein insertase [Candidatus Dependentiae bacterium]